MFKSHAFALAIRTLFWLALLFTFTMAVMPVSQLPGITLWDKALHFLAFFVLSTLGVAAYPLRPLWLIGAMLSACGALIEVVQGLPMVHRDSDVKDWIADTIAILVVIVALFVFRGRNATMRFGTIDLQSDREAAQYVKSETVQVAFAIAAGSIASREGSNHFQPGDALVTGSDGTQWSVTRSRFDARYEPIPPLPNGATGAYRNRPLSVFAKQVDCDFTVRRTRNGDLLRGRAGDWLMQYVPGDWGIVEAEKFKRVYRRV